MDGAHACKTRRRPLAPAFEGLDEHGYGSEPVGEDHLPRRAAGIADGLIRLSVGLEGVEDLIEDMERALEKV